MGTKVCPRLAETSPHWLWSLSWTQRFYSTLLTQPSRTRPLFPRCLKPPSATIVQTQPIFTENPSSPICCCPTSFSSQTSGSFLSLTLPEGRVSHVFILPAGASLCPQLLPVPNQALSWHLPPSGCHPQPQEGPQQLQPTGANLFNERRPPLASANGGTELETP